MVDAPDPPRGRASMPNQEGVVAVLVGRWCDTVDSLGMVGVHATSAGCALSLVATSIHTGRVDYHRLLSLLPATSGHTASPGEAVTRRELQWIWLRVGLYGKDTGHPLLNPHDLLNHRVSYCL